MLGDVQDGVLPRRIGVQAEEVTEGIKVGYIGARPNGGTLYHNYYATFGMKVTSNGENVVIDVSCPELMTEVGSAGFMRSWDPFIPVEMAIADLSKICREARLVFSKRENGEINVNFGEAAVFANFDRKLKPSAQNYRLDGVDNPEKFRWFTAQDGTNYRRLAIKVDPYRTGSKVTYVWNNTIECAANAGCNFDQDAAKRMDSIVSAIAND
jgi:hypothetical protein